MFPTVCAESSQGKGCEGSREKKLFCLIPAIGKLGRPPLEDLYHFAAFGRATLGGEVVYDPAVEARHEDSHWATWPPGFVPFAAALSVLYQLGRVPTQLFLQWLNLTGLAVVLLITARWTSVVERRYGSPSAPWRTAYH